LLLRLIENGLNAYQVCHILYFQQFFTLDRADHWCFKDPKIHATMMRSNDGKLLRYRKEGSLL
jgi:hypothetical protein